jgi:hypothetical protein
MYLNNRDLIIARMWRAALTTMTLLITNIFSVVSSPSNRGTAPVRAAPTAADAPAMLKEVPNLFKD